MGMDKHGYFMQMDTIAKSIGSPPSNEQVWLL